MGIIVCHELSCATGLPLLLAQLLFDKDALLLGVHFSYVLNSEIVHYLLISRLLKFQM
jgi:hypothetical protein